MIDLSNFKNQSVRDLAWVISSPPLFNEMKSKQNLLVFSKKFFETEFYGLFDYLKKLDENPDELIDHLNSGNNHLLGKYFESLTEFWLLHSKRFKVIAKNLQVESKGLTIGEFDFIILDYLTGKTLHLEIAGKFYISSANKSSWDTFIGPNANDKLSLKIHKLLNDQINLAKSDAGRKKLNELNINVEVFPALIFKGYLFYDIKSFLANSFIIPDDSNPDHIKGWKVKSSEIDSLNIISSGYWKLLMRETWVSQSICFNKEELLSIGELSRLINDYFKTNHYPLLVASMKEDSRKAYIETSRGFIVSERWPDLNFIH